MISIPAASRHRSILLLWFALMAIALGLALTTTRIRSDLSLFLPAGASTVERLLSTELQQGPAARLLLLAVEGGTAQTRTDTSRQLCESLRQSKLFSRIENGGLSFTSDRQPPLFAYRYLLSPNLDSNPFTVERLQQALTERLGELRAPLPSPFKSLLPQDPTGEYQTLLQHWLPQVRPHLTNGVWSSDDGQRALLIAETRASTLDLDEQQQAIELIERTFHSLQGSAQMRLLISGPGAFGVQSRALIQHETLLLSLLSSAGILILLLLSYRSLTYLLLSALPLASALLAGVVVTNLLFGEIHGITLAFGVTLLGVTIDYPIHLFSHLRNNLDAEHAMKGIWDTLRLGVLTTCIAYLILITTNFTGLQQLGVFTLAGLFAAALCSRLVLPILLLRRLDPPRLLGLNGLARWPQPSGKLPLLFYLLFVAAMVSMLWRGESIWQDDIAALTPLSRTLIQRDQEIRQQLHAPEANQLIFLYDENLETALQQAEKLTHTLQTLVHAGSLGGFDIASRYLPSRHTQRHRQSDLPTEDLLKAHLETALEGLPFRQDAFKPFLRDVQESRQLAPVDQAMLADTPPGMRLSSLLRHTQEGWLVMAPLIRVKDAHHLIKLLQQQLPAAQFLDLRTETSRLVAGFRQEIGERIVLGVVLMLLLLSIGLKSVSGAIRTLLPVVLAIGITMGLLTWSGTPLTLFHLISLMLVLGIGIDYSLFFGRVEQDPVDRLHTLHGLIICMLSTSIVFGLLGSSQLPVLQAIGQTVAVGVVVSFLVSYSFAHRAGEKFLR